MKRSYTLATGLLVTLAFFQNCSDVGFSEQRDLPSKGLSDSDIKSIEANGTVISVKINEPLSFSIQDMKIPKELKLSVAYKLVDAQDIELTNVSDYWGSLNRVDVASGQAKYKYVTTTLGTRPFTYKIQDQYGNVARARVIFDAGSPLLAVKPALAVRNTACIMCHASVKGNVATDFAFNEGQPAYFVHNAVAPAKGSGVLYLGNYNWRAADSLTPNFIEGTMLIPKRPLSTDKLPAIIAKLNEGKTQSMRTMANFPQAATAPDSPIYKPSIPSAKVVTAADFANAVLNHRTDAYLSHMRTDFDLPKAADVAPDTSIREILSLNIRAPSDAQLRSVFGTGALVYRRQGDDGLELKNFAQNGNYYTNSPGQWMECDGDLYVDGIVYLNQLKLKTKYGCRIYSTRTVFLSAPAGTTLNREGVVYDLSYSTKPNLQITSSRAIIAGAGKCTSSDSLVRRSQDERTDNSPRLTDVGAMADYDLMGGIITDVGDCAAKGDARRSVNLSHVLFNAPAIHSRFTGNVNGVLIAQHIVGSLGRFYYKYDSLFESVPIFPQIPSDWFFAASDCAVYDPQTGTRVSDSSFAVSGEHKYRACEAK